MLLFIDTKGFHSSASKLAIEDVGEAIDLRINEGSIQVYVKEFSDDDDDREFFEFELKKIKLSKK